MKLKFEFKNLTFQNNKGPYRMEYKWRLCENRNLYPGRIEFTTAKNMSQLNRRGGWTFYKPKKL